MSNLVSKAVVAQGTGLLCYGDRVAGVVGEGGGHPTPIIILHEESSCVSRVPQLAGGALLHVCEACEDIRILLNICFLSTEFAGSDGDLTVDITLVGFSQHLFDKPIDVCRGVLESLSVVEHDAVGDHSGRVLYSVFQRLHDGFQAPLSLVCLEGSHVVLLDNVAVVTLLNGVGLVVVCLQTAKHAACLVVESDHGLVPEAVVVDKPVGLHSRVEHQVRAEDVDVLAGEEKAGVNTDLRAEEEVVVVTASLNTPGVDRGDVDQTVAIPINYFQPGILFLDGCCKDSRYDQQEDKLHDSDGRNTSEGVFVRFATSNKCRQNYHKPTNR